MFSTSVAVVVMLSSLSFGACKCETSEFAEVAASDLETVLAISDSVGIDSALLVVTHEFFGGLTVTQYPPRHIDSVFCSNLGCDDRNSSVVSPATCSALLSAMVIVIWVRKGRNRLFFFNLAVLTLSFLTSVLQQSWVLVEAAARNYQWDRLHWILLA